MVVRAMEVGERYSGAEDRKGQEEPEWEWVGMEELCSSASYVHVEPPPQKKINKNKIKIQRRGSTVCTGKIVGRHKSKTHLANNWFQICV